MLPKERSERKSDLGLEDDEKRSEIPSESLHRII